MDGRPFDVLIIGNPNNPVSSMLKPEELLVVLAPYMDGGLTVIVDEAFIDLTRGGEDNSLIKLIGQCPDRFPNLIVVRALTKSYALPGVRLGYCIASTDRIHEMRDMQVEWSVNAFAQSAGAAIVQLDDYRNKTREWLNAELPFMYEELRKIQGLTVFEPQSNFILLKTADGAPGGAVELLDELKAELVEKYDILIRDARNFPGLDSRYFRVAIKNREDNLTLLSALHSFFTY
jgi:threonine-phosphate decarboxylase